MTLPRVAIVTTYYRPVLGGAEAAAERLAVFLHRRGHPVDVLTKRTSASHAETERIDGVTVTRLKPIGERAPAGKWVIMRGVYKTLVEQRRQFDVVCCIDYRGIGLPVLAARRRTGTPVIFQAQTEGVLSGAPVRRWLEHFGANPQGLLARTATWPIRAIYGRADAICCISRAIEREALAEGVPRDRVHYVPNPVDASRFTPATPVEREEIRERLGVPPDAVVCTFVGRLSREKGVLELARAWIAARPGARLVLIGPPMTNHPWDVSAEARALIETNGLIESVKFLGGQPTDVVAAWLRASDFSVQPSHFEAMGLAAAESMAAGVPVIASDIGGYRDFIRHDENGLLVPINDMDALGAAILRLVSDAPMRHRLGEAARTTALQFDEPVVLERFAELIDRLAGGARPLGRS